MKRSSRETTWAVALGALASALMTGQAAVSQFSGGGQPLRWNFDAFDAASEPVQNPATLAIRYTLALEGYSVTNRVAELNAIRAAFGQWQSVPGTKVKFEESGAVFLPTDVNPVDGQNVVVWLSGSRFLNGGATFFPNTARGITLISTGADGVTLAEADIVLNRNLDWFTDFDLVLPNDFFVESVALHEIGHLLGLNHAALGGATMFWTNPGGVDHSAGLSSDEISGLRTVYGTAVGNASVGRVTGAVTLNGAPVLGAVVTVEDPAGNAAACAVTTGSGAYAIGGLSPGSYTLRVTPLDPPTSGDTYLVRGADLDVSSRGAWSGANTAFLPLTNTTVTVTAGGSVQRNLAVAGGNPPVRIVEMRRGTNPAVRSSGDFCVQLQPGVSGQSVGVYVPALSGTNVVLRLTGDGVSYGVTQVIPNALRTLTLVQVSVSVSADAAPGLRSLSLTANGFTAWANGFAEILPAVPDFNGDGLDDRFQRRYFDPFTQSAAGPEQDPDGDGFVNRREAVMGSDPTKASSVNWRVTNVKLTAQGTTVTWESAPGRKYQVQARDNLAGSTWQTVGNPVTAGGESSELLDARPADQLRFYRVQDAP